MMAGGDEDRVNIVSAGTTNQGASFVAVARNLTS